MSVAIVAMVNHTANIDDSQEIKTVNECGEAITNETEAAQRVSIYYYNTESYRFSRYQDESLREETY